MALQTEVMKKYRVKRMQLLIMHTILTVMIAVIAMDFGYPWYYGVVAYLLWRQSILSVSLGDL